MRPYSLPWSTCMLFNATSCLIRCCRCTAIESWHRCVKGVWFEEWNPKKSFIARMYGWVVFPGRAYTSNARGASPTNCPSRLRSLFCLPSWDCKACKKANRALWTIRTFAAFVVSSFWVWVVWTILLITLKIEALGLSRALYLNPPNELCTQGRTQFQNAFTRDAMHLDARSGKAFFSEARAIAWINSLIGQVGLLKSETNEYNLQSSETWRLHLMPWAACQHSCTGVAATPRVWPDM